MKVLLLPQLLFVWKSENASVVTGKAIASLKGGIFSQKDDLGLEITLKFVLKPQRKDTFKEVKMLESMPENKVCKKVPPSLLEVPGNCFHKNFLHKIKRQPPAAFSEKID